MRKVHEKKKCVHLMRTQIQYLSRIEEKKTGERTNELNEKRMHDKTNDEERNANRSL